ncbi:hypothetical protein Q5P01_021649 [Channa striata]|uniref:Uncharacterized protein n=1 Tax=Channa striata TaxID=64152 RepID=A0AA88LUG4_CHASR|nr:hypothetical protein Q5P01_021649 [Channa striata]
MEDLVPHILLFPLWTLPICFSPSLRPRRIFSSAAARLRSASRGSAAFGAGAGRMAEKRRRWTLPRRIPTHHVAN